MANIVKLNGGAGEDIKLSGTATSGDVLKGQTFYSNDPKIKQTGTLELTGNTLDHFVLEGYKFYNIDPRDKRTGTMTNKGSWSATINPGGSVTIPWGFHSGSGTVKASAAGAVLLPSGYIVKTGTMSYSACNNNSKIIPIKLQCTIGRYYTSSPSVKYGNTTVFSQNIWDNNHGGTSTATVSLYNLNDLKNATKQTITLYNPDSTNPVCNVIEWLERV